MYFFWFIFIGFSITNAVAFLHVFSIFRRIISGLSDAGFRLMIREGVKLSFRERFFGKLVRCHACMGFWVGAFLSWYGGGCISRYVDNLSQIDTIVADGFMLSGANFIIWLVLRKLGAEEF